jgi:hypothetical protein
MKDISDKNFGVLIAFALPGFIFLWGLSFSNDLGPLTASLLKNNDSSIGGFLTITFASVSAGMILSAVRWLLFDRLLLRGVASGLREINVEKLTDTTFPIFQGIVENHYRYYQYYSNTFIAVGLAFLSFIFWGKAYPGIPIVVSVLLLCAVLFLASRDSLLKYSERARKITK